ncbi:hypothetical protein FD03_GL001441 [Companilactobacillus nodensis DSM 19682 = JCM 14932 = NBRC 107160]|uniref:Cell surface protein n=3 Tax=Companilactobacillus nodensis TaxID=460870 RepID=A0A0R1K643_9LACO|nr:hypothetical protein [Companilactobacillus nodensis]KRK79078.1 hypothetical protein FD03_GL001441 [Companilactobacillus nodensis DSM 19682 = JCM 14932 = NBRC 107160]
MKKGKVVTTVGIVVLFCVSLIIGINYSISVHAATAYIPQSTLVSRGPEGIKLGNYFDYNSDSTFSTNHAVSVTSDYYPDTTDILELSNGANQLSSVWSNNKDNYFDASKPQTLSVWLYLGANELISHAGEGVAFVLQNSGTNAISRDLNGNPASGQTLGVWGDDTIPDTTNYSNIIKLPNNTADEVAKRAIQNSWALEFDTNINQTVGKLDYTDNIITLDNDDGDTLKNDPVTQDYDDTGLDDGTTTKQVRDQHIAWNYPGAASTYVVSPTKYLNNTKLNGFLTGQYKTIDQYQMDHDPEKSKEQTDEDADMIYGAKNDVDMTAYATSSKTWHHLTIKYTPPADGNLQTGTGKINYSYNDKKYDGTNGTYKNNGMRYGISDVDMKQFHLTNGQNKLYYGFTGSTGANGSYDALIFETMPSVVEAKADQTITDTTQNKTVTDGSTVSSGDDLKLEYNLNYIDGKAPLSNIRFEHVPIKDLSYGDSNGIIGQINNADGSTSNITKDDLTNYIPDPDSPTVTSQEIIKAINGELSGDTSAVTVTLYAKANTVTSDTTEDSTRSTFIGDLYKKDLASPTFTINANKPHIEPTGGTDNQTVQSSSDFQLLGDITEVNDKNEPQIFKVSDMKISTKINDGSWTTPSTLVGYAASTTNSYNLMSSMNSSALNKEGENHVYIRAIDSNGNVSNVADYKITVNDYTLKAKADNPIIDVTNDDPINITGTFAHIDGAALESGTAEVYIKVTNEDGTTSSERAYSTDNASGKFSVALKPYAYDMNSNADNQAESYDDFLSDWSNTMGLLKEGTNVVSLRIVDADSHKSTPITYTINVPKITPKLTIDSPSQTSVNTNFNIPVKADLGSGYSFNAKNLKYSVTANGVTKTIIPSAPVTNQVGPVSSPFSSTVDAFNFDKNKAYPMTITATDVYGRKSAPLDVSFTYVENILNLSVGNYSFKTLNLNGINNELVPRKGNWDIDVESYKTDWDLSATGSDMYKSLADGSKQKLNGNLVYVDKADQSHLLDNQLIDEDYSGSATDKHTDVSDDWTANEGILLDLYSSEVSGNYTGTINWTLVQAP